MSSWFSSVLNGSVALRNGDAGGNAVPAPDDGLGPLAPSRDQPGASASQAPPRVVGAGLRRYVVGRCLGRGASGVVHEGVDQATGERVAVKEIELTNLTESVVDGIEKEVRLLQRLQHKNIVKYIAHFRHRRNLFIVLEFMEGGSLGDLVARGPLDEARAAAVVLQILEGLAYLHSQGVTHRDIKGANILFNSAGEVKLADFGVAVDQGDTLGGRGAGQAGRAAGTAWWIAPEVIQTNGQLASTSSDIWSVGCLVHELVTGKPPYKDLKPEAAIWRIANDAHPPLPRDAGLSVELEDLLLCCWEKDVPRRSSATEMMLHPWFVLHLSGARGGSLALAKSHQWRPAEAQAMENALLRGMGALEEARSRAMEAEAAAGHGGTLGGGAEGVRSPGLGDSLRAGNGAVLGKAASKRLHKRGPSRDVGMTTTSGPWGMASTAPLSTIDSSGVLGAGAGGGTPAPANPFRDMELSKWLLHATAHCEDVFAEPGDAILGQTLPRPDGRPPLQHISLYRSDSSAASALSPSAAAAAAAAGGEGLGMDAVLGRMYAVSVSPTGGVPGPAWKQGSELSRWLSFEEGAALEDRTALKDLHVRVGRAAEAMERALSPLPLRGSALLPGGDGAERAAEINKACGELYAFVRSVEDGAASDMFLEFFQGGALAGDLLENATPDTADAIATLVKSIGEDSAAFCHYLCSHGAVPALVRLCGPEFSLKARRMTLSFLLRAMDVPGCRSLIVIGGGAAGIGRLLLKLPLRVGDTDRLAFNLRNYLSDALEAAWKLLEDPAPGSTNDVCRRLASAGVVPSLAAALEFVGASVAALGPARALSEAQAAARSKLDQVCSSALRVLLVMAHADYAVKLHFCQEATVQPLLSTKSLAALDETTRLRIVQALRVVASHGAHAATAEAGGDLGARQRVGELLGATTALSSAVALLSGAVTAIGKQGPLVGAGEADVNVDLVYEAMSAVYYMAKGYPHHQQTAASMSLSVILVELAVHRHRAELSSDPFDRLSPDHYQRDAQGVPHLTAKAKVSRAADMAMLLLCSMMTGTPETKNRIRDGAGGVSGRELEVLLSAMGEREWEREVFKVLLIWLGDKAGVVEPKLEQRDAEIVALMDPDRYVLRDGSLDVRRLVEVLEPLEKLLLRCKRVAEKLTTRRLGEIIGHLCGYFSPRFAGKTTAPVWRVIVKVVEALYEMAPGGDKARFVVDARLTGVLRALAESSDPSDAVVTEQVRQLLDAFRIAEVL